MTKATGKRGGPARWSGLRAKVGHFAAVTVLAAAVFVACAAGGDVSWARGQAVTLHGTLDRTVAVAVAPGAHRKKCARGKERIRGRCVLVPKAARRPRGAPPQNVATPSDLPGYGAGPGAREDGALQWAKAQIGSSNWYFMCERFVEVAYGTSGRFASAWSAARSIGLHLDPITSAPPGTLVFFGPDSTNLGYGHAGISVGGGRMVSALTTVQISDVAHSAYWRGLYRGWAYAPSSWPGRAPTSVPPPPSPPSPTPPSPTPPPAVDTATPSIPGALSVSNVSSSTLRLNWAASSDNVGVTGYDAFLNGTKVGTVSVLDADYTGLSCGTSFTLSVDARDAAGNVSAQTSIGAATSACPPPTVWVTKGAPATTSGCTSVAYCAQFVVHFANFASGNHNVVCYSDYPPPLGRTGATRRPTRPRMDAFRMATRALMFGRLSTVFCPRNSFGKGRHP
jgi:hypothetical protein